MIKIIFQVCICIFPFASSFSQENGRLALSANFGLNGNFFVKSYDENGGPGNSASFYGKDFIGTAGGMELKYHFNLFSNLQIGYMHSVNKRAINYTNEPTIPRIVIRDLL